MPAPTPTQQPKPSPTTPGTALVSWALLFMAMAAFVPCIVLPEWRAYQQVCQAEQAEQHRLANMQQVVDRERRNLDAIQRDPAVLARMAKRELHFQQEGMRTVAVAVVPLKSSTPAAFIATPVLGPRWLRRFTDRLPALDYDNIFCDNGSRTTIMAMSVGLMLLGVSLATQRTS